LITIYAGKVSPAPCEMIGDLFTAGKVDKILKMIIKYTYENRFSDYIGTTGCPVCISLGWKSGCNRFDMQSE